MLRVRIELTTVGLWDLRAANCAIAAMMVSKKSSFTRQDTPAEALSCIHSGCMRSVLLRLCAAELPTQNKFRRIWNDIPPNAHELPKTVSARGFDVRLLLPPTDAGPQKQGSSYESAVGQIDQRIPQQNLATRRGAAHKRAQGGRAELALGRENRHRSNGRKN